MCNRTNDASHVGPPFKSCWKLEIHSMSPVPPPGRARAPDHQAPKARLCDFGHPPDHQATRRTTSRGIPGEEHPAVAAHDHAAPQRVPGASLLAVRRRVRLEHRGARHSANNHRLCAPEPRPPRAGRACDRLAVVKGNRKMGTYNISGAKHSRSAPGLLS